MATLFEESTSRPTASSSSSGNNNNNDASEFECSICFELANYPIVTLCSHLFCWPCLHRWLQLHSQTQECPVSKALIQEDKLVPIYGRGSTPTDPRSRPVPGVDIPNRPHGQRPPNAPNPPPQHPLEQQHFSNLGFGLLGLAVAVIVEGSQSSLIEVQVIAGDLAVAAAICSSFLEFPVPNNVAFIGEIGLGGELLMVPKIEKRVNTIAKLGYKRCIIPKSAEASLHTLGFTDLEIIGCKNVKEVINKVFCYKK